jgi:phage repressor protein C with HTH and peptisase S24 domain
MSILPRPPKGRKRPALKNPGFHARLRQLIGDEAPYAWAERMGISKGAFTRIWKEGTVPTSELLLRIREATGVSLDWLLLGERGQPDMPEQAGGDVAFISEYIAGSSRGRSIQGRIALMRQWLPRQFSVDPAALAWVTVNGDAMAPTLAQGDLAVLDRRITTLDQEGIYVLRQGPALRVRRIQRLADDRYQALSDNSRYQPFTFRVTPHLMVVGRVVWVGKWI